MKSFLLILVHSLFVSIIIQGCGTPPPIPPSPLLSKKAVFKYRNQEIPQRLIIQGEASILLLNVELTSREAFIAFEGQRIFGQIADLPAPNIYIDKNADIIGKATVSGDILALRKNDGQLLWKIKVLPNQLKVADNEEFVNAREIIKLDSNRMKVTLAGKEFARVRFKDKQITIEVGKNILETPADRNSFAYGLFMLADIPKEYRYALMTELLYRNL
jgi:hypothetical protein